ncbi:SH3 domain-containing protein [Ideonella sp.]|uniref:SH3 domain-containing protein n=1 Tax=Ideonella sp. TaxID=1929293 RepID=UPI002B4A0DD4|nr:SH3 domain-containing protein [Ideonella sp.]HJV68444.1 SH3 domain-containing protein [Ideonella sp.]
MLKPWIASMLVCAASALQPAAADTAIAYTERPVNLRAGPARGYPIVAVLPSGLEVSVLGCVRDYTWCDVVAGPDRGWVYAAFLDYPYQGARVPILRYGPEIGIAIVGFVLMDYWMLHYNDRPWYHDRDRWVHRYPPPPPPHRPAPPPRDPRWQPPANPAPPLHPAPPSKPSPQPPKRPPPRDPIMPGQPQR